MVRRLDAEFRKYLSPEELAQLRDTWIWCDPICTTTKTLADSAWGCNIVSQRRHTRLVDRFSVSTRITFIPHQTSYCGNKHNVIALKFKFFADSVEEVWDNFVDMNTTEDRYTHYMSRLGIHLKVWPVGDSINPVPMAEIMRHYTLADLLQAYNAEHDKKFKDKKKKNRGAIIEDEKKRA